MRNTIIFPNLGIWFENLPSDVSIFGFRITYYGIFVGIALMAGIALACLTAVRTRQKAEDYLQLSIAGILLGIAGARVVYVMFSWEYFKNDPGSIFRFRDGGFAFYGALLGGAGAVFLLSRIKELYPMAVFDTVAPALAVGQAIGRWGDFFGRESFGEYSDGIFAMQLPVSAVRAADVTEKMRNHVVQIENVNFIQVHPAFLYESFWCVILAVVLAVFWKKKKQDGEIFMIYLLGYGVGRFWIEGIRADALLIPGIEIPIARVFSALCVLLAAAFLVSGRMGTKKHWKAQGKSRMGKPKKKFFGK